MLKENWPKGFCPLYMVLPKHIIQCNAVFEKALICEILFK